jgi:hypothetical protein
MNKNKFLKDKKSQSLAIKSILILILSLTFVLSNIWFYVSYQDFFFKDEKTKVQTYHNIILEKCFNSEKEFDIISIKEFNSKNLEKCLILDDTIIYLELDNKKIFFPNKEEFENKLNLCNNLNENSLFCNEQIFPVKIKENSKIKKLKIITII